MQPDCNPPQLLLVMRLTEAGWGGGPSIGIVAPGQHLAGSSKERGIMTETPNGIVAGWLEQFDVALRTRDTEAVLELFDEESYWRDFVSFTWNLKTMEGKDSIRRMLEATLNDVGPHNWALAEEATGDASSTEAWVAFETAQARGYAHLRLRNGKCWTLLTTMQELKGFEEKKGAQPRAGRGPPHREGPKVLA
jgi:putative flavoprotein involved in K+ transport